MELFRLVFFWSCIPSGNFFVSFNHQWDFIHVGCRARNGNSFLKQIPVRNRNRDIVFFSSKRSRDLKKVKTSHTEFRILSLVSYFHHSSLDGLRVREKKNCQPLKYENGIGSSVAAMSSRPVMMCLS